MENPIRKAFYLFLVTGLLLPSCNGGDIPDAEAPPSAEEVEEETYFELLEVEEGAEGNIEVEQVEPDETQAEPQDDSAYKDGSYTETGSYQSPGGPESIGVTLTIQEDVVTAVSIQKNATLEKSVNFQTLFEAGITALVVGKSMDEIGPFSSVNGSSLTPIGFQNALSAIKAEASQ